MTHTSGISRGMKARFCSLVAIMVIVAGFVALNVIAAANPAVATAVAVAIIVYAAMSFLEAVFERKP